MASSVPRLNLVVLYTRNIASLVAFYGALGLSFVQHRHGTGPEHFAGESDGVVFEIYPAVEGGMSTYVRIGFLVENLSATLDALETVGSKVLNAPKQSPWGLRAVVLDPDGNRVELVEQIGDPLWTREPDR